MLAVIPNFVLFGPLAVLGLIFPALLASLALFVRRWRLLLTILSIESTVVMGHSWLRGYFQASWWSGAAGLWATMAVVAFAGIPFAWRQGKASRVHASAATAAMPVRSGRALTTIILLLIGLACTGLTFEIRNPKSEIRNPKRVLWMFEQVERGAILSSPLVADDAIYVSTIRDMGVTAGGAVYRLDRRTGTVVWRFDDDGRMQHTYSSPCLADGRIFVGEGLHANFVCKLYCLDAETGQKIWDHATSNHIESTPSVVAGRVFVCAGDDGVYCLDAPSGKVRWHFQVALHVDSSPAVVGNRLYAGSGTSRRHRATEVFCLDTNDGKVVWRTPTDLPVWGSPAVEGGRVFVGLGEGRLTQNVPGSYQHQGAVLCLSAQDGQCQWRYDVSDAVLAKPALDAHHVYFGARDGFCYSVDRRRGRLQWKQTMGSPVVTTPALFDNHLCAIASEGRVCRLQTADGAIDWIFDIAQVSQTRPRLYSSPVAAAGANGPRHCIYFGAELRGMLSSAAVLYCLSDEG